MTNEAPPSPLPLSFGRTAVCLRQDDRVYRLTWKRLGMAVSRQTLVHSVTLHIRTDGRYEVTYGSKARRVLYTGEELRKLFLDSGDLAGTPPVRLRD